MIEGRTTYFTPRPCLQGRGRGGVNKAPYVRAVVKKHGIMRGLSSGKRRKYGARNMFSGQ